MGGIVVVDYSSSNLRSVYRALRYVAASDTPVTVSADIEVLRNADRIVFPGQGAMGQCMSGLRQQGLDKELTELIQTKPFLGICLGLQILFEYSEEDQGSEGLGILPGQVYRFAADRTKTTTTQDTPNYKVPHIGWNRVRQVADHPLWEGIPDNSWFYFAHSYYTPPSPETLGSTRYMVEYTTALASGNLFATQFHPEKSQQVGLQLLENFITWQGDSQMQPVAHSKAGI